MNNMESSRGSPAPGEMSIATVSTAEVSGCQHSLVGPIVTGTYAYCSQNHGKPTYKKTEQVNGVDVLLYFWDQRDGPMFWGWWFGPVVGGDRVWAYNSDRHSSQPPRCGWQVPFDAIPDPTMEVNLGARDPPVTHGRACQERSRSRRGRDPKGSSMKFDRSTKTKDKEKSSREARDRGKRRKRSSSLKPARTRRAASPQPWVTSAAASSGLTGSAAASRLPSVQFPPSIDVVYAAATAQPEEILHGQAGALDSFILDLEVTAQRHHDEGEPWFAGATWGLAFLLKHHANDVSAPSVSARLWCRFREVAGNMLHVFSDDVEGIAGFFSTYPAAASCCAIWGNSADMLPLLMASATAAALSMAGDAIPAKLFVQSLEMPTSLPALIASLEKFAACKHSHAERAQRLSDIAGVLQHRARDEVYLQLRNHVLTWHAVGGHSLRDALIAQQTSHSLQRPLQESGGQATLPVKMGSGVDGVHPLPAPDSLSDKPASATPTLPTSHQVLLAAGHLSSSRGQRVTTARRCLECDVTTFADLRERWPPADPADIHRSFQRLAAAPASADSVTYFSFIAPAGCQDREARWHFWLALADIGYFVQELYLGTNFLADANSQAGIGATGQHVVYAGPDAGTVLWMQRTGRLYTPNGNMDLLRRLRRRFPPFCATVTGAAAFQGRWPATSPSSTSPATAAGRFDFSSFQ